MARYAIIDVETTGGTARYERITEIAIVVHDGEKIIDQFSTLINPERSIPPNIVRITGITDDMVADAPRFYEVAKQVVELTEGAVFVAHNVQFDYSFIREEFARLGYSFTRKKLCTVRLSRATFPGLRSYSLSNLKKHFGIHADRSHRALDDTLATVELFERILAQQDSKSGIKKMVNYGVRESGLPAAITIERLHQLPETCGVYYLHDGHGQVIYVGKSLNIRKRMFEHFADQTPKGDKMRKGVADISYVETGSELLALLLESSEIKRYQPAINRALRARRMAACIFTYTDQNGYVCLAIGKKTARNLNSLEILGEYTKIDSARNHLHSLVRQHELCEKLCNLDSRERACFQYNLKKCQGACIGEEPTESYNERVLEAISQMKKGLEGSFILVDKGRNAEEKTFIGVLDGVFCGYKQMNAADAPAYGPQLLEELETLGPDPDANRIIRTFIESGSRIRRLDLG
ncbi:MAG: exonuclease domain-containing protein [Saprospiraceae bacterium]